VRATGVVKWTDRIKSIGLSIDSYWHACCSAGTVPIFTTEQADDPDVLVSTTRDSIPWPRALDARRPHI
jgi:hypothetical protein